MAEDDIVTTAKKIIINEVARKTTDPTIITECVIVNQSEATIITEVGSKIPEATNSNEEKPREMTSIFDEGTSGMTITYELGIVSQRKTTIASDEETNAMTTINEVVFVKSTKLNCRDLEAGIFPGVSLKAAMIGTGKCRAVIAETPGKYSLPTGTDDGRTFPAKICLTSRFLFQSYRHVRYHLLVTSVTSN